MGCVYLLRSPSGKGYVGFTTGSATKRFRRHVGSSLKGRSRLGAAIRKYGPRSFQISILAEAETRAELVELEKTWIANLGTRAPSGYNLTSGGEGAPDLSPEIEALRLARSAKSRRGKPLSEKHRQRLSEAHVGLPNPNKGKRLSPEACARMRAAALARWADPEKRKAALSFTQSDATIEKRRRSLTGVKHSDERRQIEAVAQKRRYSNPAERKKQSERLSAYYQGLRDA